jgi:hypothetical protein
MTARLRRLLLIPAAIVGGLIVLYLLFGWFAFDPFARWYLPKQVAERSGYRLELQSAKFNPLTLAVELKGVMLSDPAGKPLLKLDRVLADADSWGVIRSTVELDEIRLERPVVMVEIPAKGRINWLEFIEAIEARQPPAAAPKPGASPARVVVRRFVMDQGRVEFSDDTVPGGFKTQLDPLNLSFDELSTLPNEQGDHTLSAHLGIGADLRWKGRFGFSPMTAVGELAIDNINLASIWPYVERSVHLAPPGGKVSVSLGYDAAYADKRFTLKLDPVSARLEKLSIVDDGFVQPLTAELADFKLSFRADATGGSGSPEFNLDGLQLTAQDLRLRSGKDDAPWFRLGKLAVENAFLKLARQEVGAARISLSDGKLVALRDAQGAITLAKAFERKAAAAASAPAAPASAASSPAWRYQLARVDATQFGVSFVDQSVSPPATVELQNIGAEAQGVSSGAKAKMPVRLGLDVKSGGRLDVKGEVVPANLSADLQLALKDLSVAPAQPYLAQLADLVLASGRVDVDGRVRYADKQARYDGQVALRELAINEKASGENFLSWKSLSSRKLSATQQKLNAADLDLVGLDTKLEIDKDRTINVVKAFKKGDKAAAPAAAASAPPATEAPAASKPPAYALAVDRIRISESKLSFADLSLALPFAARIHDLRGRLTGVSNTDHEPSRVDLTGAVNEYGVARISGRIDLLEATKMADMKVKFENIEMTSLTPYSATFAGRRIDSGKLSLDLEYKLDDRKVTGDNKVIMDKLTLGERVESARAMDLPLDLALSILKDSNGRIELGLPVSGSLDDPQFSYMSVLWKALGDALARVITAPFRAIGGLFGGDDKGGETPVIVFDAGASELRPPEREKLDTLAKAIGERPALSLTITGGYDASVDDVALRRRQVRRAITQEMSQGARAAEAAASAASAASAPERPERRRALESVFRKAFGDEALGTVASAESSVLVERLVEREQVKPEQLAALANARAEAVRNQLASKGVAAERLRVEAPKAQDGGGAVATLGLVAPAATSAAR